MQAAENPQPATDPRIERSHRLVRRAALAELAERGWGGLTIEGIAARAGVARSTVYRHWPSKLAVVSDALEVLNRQPPRRPDGETPRERVEALLSHLAVAVIGSEVAPCIPALVEAAEQSADLRRLLHDFSTGRRRALVEAIAAGVEAGDFAPGTDPELAAESLSGAIFYRRLMLGEPFPPDRVDELADLVLGGVWTHAARWTSGSS